MLIIVLQINPGTNPGEGCLHFTWYKYPWKKYNSISSLLSYR